MPKFRVIVREVWEVPYEVEANDDQLYDWHDPEQIALAAEQKAEEERLRERCATDPD